MEKSNLDVRAELMERGIRNWQLADLLGCAETTLSRYLRREWPKSLKDKVIRLIDGENVSVLEIRNELTAVGKTNKPYNSKIRQNTERIINDVERLENIMELERKGWL